MIRGIIPVYSRNLVFLGAAVCALASRGQETARPNILFVMCDDLGDQAISCYGHSPNRTPGIDRIAKEGMRFTHAFVTNSLSGPSRAVLLTGKHSHLNGIRANDGTPFDGSQRTFPKLLQASGYETAIIGKWHLVSDPTGFNYWSILRDQGDYYQPEFITNGTREKKTGYATDLITSEAIRWLRERQDTTKPFCLMVHHKAPHRNWMPPVKYLNLFDTVKMPVPSTFFDDYSGRGRAAKEQKMEIARDLISSYDLKLFDTGIQGPPFSKEDGWLNRFTNEELIAWENAYRKKNRDFFDADLQGDDLALWKYERFMQDYLATVASVDENMDLLLDYLDRSGLKDNTLIIFTSDQGFYLGEHGWFDKRFMYEPSLRTPLLVCYPGRIEPGSVCESMVQNLDFAETILDYAGIPIPRDMQGVSFRPLLEGKKQAIRDAIYYQYYEYPAVHSVKRHYGIRTDRYKLIHFYFDCDEWEFYDLQNDPDEMVNQYGNPDYKQQVIMLEKQLKKLRRIYKVPGMSKEFRVLTIPSEE